MTVQSILDSMQSGSVTVEYEHSFKAYERITDERCAIRFNTWMHEIESRDIHTLVELYVRKYTDALGNNVLDIVAMYEPDDDKNETMIALAVKGVIYYELYHHILNQLKA